MLTSGVGTAYLRPRPQTRGAAPVSYPGQFSQGMPNLGGRGGTEASVSLYNLQSPLSFNETKPP